MMRRRPDAAEAFASAWDRRRSGATATGEGRQVDELIRTAELLCEAATVAPREEFRLDLRERLMAEATTVLVAQPDASADRPAARTVPTRARRRLAGIAAAAIASVGAVGLVTSSAHAVPGDALYSLKRGVETVQLSLRHGQESQGAYQLDRASERLQEAKELVADGAGVDDARVADLLDDFSNQTDAGSADLLDAYSSEGSDDAVTTLGQFTNRAAADLTTLSESFDGATPDPLRRATDTVRDLAGHISSICKSCTDVSDLIAAVSAQTEPAPSASKARSTAEAAKKPSTDRSSKQISPPAATSPAAPPKVLTPPSSTPPSKSGGVGKVVKGVTDPVVGGLLGNDDQPGLVPGLLGGLLGNQN